MTLAVREPASKVLIWAADPAGREAGACSGDSGAHLVSGWVDRDCDRRLGAGAARPWLRRPHPRSAARAAQGLDRADRAQVVERRLAAALAVYIGRKVYNIGGSSRLERSDKGGRLKHAREAPDALRFHAELQQRSSVAACSALFKDAVSQFEIVAFACGEIDLADRDRNVMFIAEWPEAWLRYYLKSGFMIGIPSSTR